MRHSGANPVAISKEPPKHNAAQLTVVLNYFPLCGITLVPEEPPKNRVASTSMIPHGRAADPRAADCGGSPLSVAKPDGMADTGMQRWQ